MFMRKVVLWDFSISPSQNHGMQHQHGCRKRGSWGRAGIPTPIVVWGCTQSVMIQVNDVLLWFPNVCGLLHP